MSWNGGWGGAWSGAWGGVTSGGDGNGGGGSPVGEARLLLIRVLPEAGATHFNLEFSDGTAWVPYDDTNASPTAPRDIPVGALDAHYDYLLDGINAPTGNEAAASIGPLYRLRLKGAGGYGNWSQPFLVEPEEIAPTAYYSPTAADIRRRTGVNRFIDQVTEEQLDATLLLLLPDAEVRTALAVTPAVFDSTNLSSRQVTALQISVSKRTGAEYLRGIVTERATATHSPLLMEVSAQILAAAEALEAEAAVYDTLAAGVPIVQPDGETDQGGLLGVLETGKILIDTPNEYLDSWRPAWVDPTRVLVP